MIERSKKQILEESKEDLARAQMAIGSAIDLYLTANKETMQSFSKRTGINASMLTSYRRGDPARDTAPSLENLIRIKKGIDMSYDRILGVNDDDSLNGNLDFALSNSSYYVDNGKNLMLSKIQKATIKRLIYAYLNITNPSTDPDLFKKTIRETVQQMMKNRDGQNG